MNKKHISPPTNWEVFEDLCKKLFGEVWGCHLTIKKNGRLGQAQAGVDVYGKPEGETSYWGVQCKGKDNYGAKKLTKAEIDKEVKNARDFKPALATFIIATTAQKDAKIEEYVRQLDIKNCEEGSFSIVLMCWEDLADLIEENRNTFNWWVNQTQFKDRSKVSINVFTDNDQNVLVPKFLKTVTERKLESEASIREFENQLFIPQSFLNMPTYSSLFGPSEINHGWCKVTVEITNSGSTAFDDWKFELTFAEGAKKIDDDFTIHTLIADKDAGKNRTSWAIEEEKIMIYEPLDNDSLVPKDSRFFKCFCLPEFETKQVTMDWTILSRDYHDNGQVTMDVVPEFEVEYKTEIVYDESEVGVSEEISDYITKP